MSREIVINTDIKREPGYLYFVQSDKDGNVQVCRSKMNRLGRKKKKKDKKKDKK